LNTLSGLRIIHCYRYIVHVVCFLSTAIVALRASAQIPTSLHFEGYTINEGLSQGFVSTILQDNKGFLWFGTNDGLNKYDGYTFTIFRHSPGDPHSIAEDDISCLHEDAGGRIWIGLRGKGIDIYDPTRDTFRHIRQKSINGLRSDFILGIQEDRSGVFWIRSRAGIDRLQFMGDSMIFTPILLDSLHEQQRVKSGVEGLKVDSRGRKFITTNTTVLELVFNDSLNTYKLLERYRYTPSTPAFIAAILEDTVNRCFYFNSGRYIHKFPDYNFSKGRVIADYEGTDIRWTIDRNHNLWLMGQNNIQLVNTRRRHRIYVQPDVAEQVSILSALTCFYTDRTGVVWLGSGGFGILKYDPATAGFNHVMRGGNIYQLVEGRDGKIITNNLNALDLAGDSVRNIPGYIDHPALTGNINMSFTKDTAGNLWFGRNGMLLRYDPVSRNIEQIDIPFTEFVTLPFPLLGDKGSRIWMGYNRYLVSYDWATRSFKRYDYPGDYIQYDYDYLQSIYQDEDLLWLGSKAGLYGFDMLKEQMVHNFVSNEKDTTTISMNQALSFCADEQEPERYLWVGTRGGGLNRLDKRTGKFISYTTRHGLPNNVVYGILPDYDGHLWLSTNRGISAFHIATHTFRNFDVSDGLQSNEFNRYAFLRTSEGFMIFGGLNGINYFRTDEMHPLDPPEVVFTDFKLFNRSVQPGRPGSPLQRSIGATEQITLRYKQNVVTFQFAAMDYRKKGSIRYRYRMEGFDRDWNYSGATREATYTNLDPGHYRFVVQASFENGAWSIDNPSIALRVITPWYRTWWFYTLAALTTLAVAYGIYRFRLYQLRRVDTLRNRIARDLHDEVGSSISTIAIYSKIVEEQMGNISFEKEPLLKKINDFATDIMASMNDIVWSINTKNDAFEHIISRMREHATELLEAKGVRLHFSFDEQVLRLKLGMERRREFYLIYKEALNNAAKYAEARNVWITIQVNDNRITLRIRDDGKGFDPETRKRSGNGLANMQQRATLLQGKLEVRSAVGDGTEMVLSIVTS
jgi:ligand-binding sensor domain-containing protein/two-component sensor histidine kinase